MEAKLFTGKNLGLKQNKHVQWAVLTNSRKPQVLGIKQLLTRVWNNLRK